MSIVLLGEVSNSIMGQAPPGNACNKEGKGTPFVKAGEFSERFPVIREWTTDPLKFSKADDVLICVVGATAGKINQGIDCAIGRSVAAIRPNPQRLNSNFLYYFMRQKAEEMRAKSQGLAQGVITRDMIAAIEIPLPPLEKQKRIAAILDQADTLRRKRQRALDRLNQLGQAIFMEMFGDKNSISGWNCDVVELTSICKKITDGTHQAPAWAETGIPFLFVSNVRNQRIDLDTKKFVSPEEFEKLTKHTKIEGGDILYTCVGSYGHTAIVDGTTVFAFQRHIAHLKPNLEIVSPTFLAWCLEAPTVKAQADKLATGIAQKTVTLSALKTFKVPLPSMKLQSDFQKCIFELSITRARMEAEKLSQDQLFTSLQSRAFKGVL